MSPAPQPYDFYSGRPLQFLPGDSYLFELRSDGGAILAETDIAHSAFHSILLDTAGDAYALGTGSAALPHTAIQSRRSAGRRITPRTMRRRRRRFRRRYRA